MKTIQTILLLLFSIVFLNCSSDKNITKTSDSAILLQNLHVVNVLSGKISKPRDVLIDEEKIKAVKRAGSKIEAPKKIDCTGKYLIPGLFDCHTHLAFLTTMGKDTMTSRLADFVRRGVLHVRDVGSPIDVISEMNRKTTTGEIMGPGIFYTGPMLESSPLHWEPYNKQLPGFTVAVNNEEDIDKLLPTLAEQGASMVKTFNHIRLPLYRYLIKAARQQGLKVVHDPGVPLMNWVPINEAIDLGVTTIEHAMAPWPFVLKHELKEKNDSVAGPNGDPEEQRSVMAQVAEAGVEGVSEKRLKNLSDRMVKKHVFLCPTLKVFEMFEEQEREAANQKGKDTGDNEEHLFRKKMTAAMKDVSFYFVRKLTGYGVKMLVGQDNVDPKGTLEEMKLMKEGGVSDVEILKGATIYPAQWLEVDDKLGSIKPGKSADLVVLDADPLENIANVGKIFIVIQRGAIIDETD